MRWREIHAGIHRRKDKKRNSKKADRKRGAEEKERKDKKIENQPGAALERVVKPR